ncbi:MAG: thioesterase, partial [Bdellovibrionaceae bacterium]|nr:thioesterase [Pseudobdellovibrionaceae bacterium]
HTQTLISHVVPSVTPEHVWSQHIIKLPDGDELLAEYIDNKADVTLSVYHGLSGNSKSDYMRRTAEVGLAQGWNIVLVNHRGAHPKAFARQTYHSGRSEDASAAIGWARSHFANSKQVAVGYSLSGSILLNLLTGRHGGQLPDFGIVVNAPLKLDTAARRLSQGLSRIYDFRFYFKLRRFVKARNVRLPHFGTMYDFDDAYTSVANGFKDADDYYAQCSVFDYLDRIQAKTFVLSSFDDPFIDVQDYLSANWNENTNVTLLKYGGHMGYYSRDIDSKYGRRWLDHYLESVFNQIKTMI